MVRFSLIVLLLLVSLLAVFRAPTNLLWLLSAIVQGFPWAFALVVLLLLFTGGYKGKFGMANALCSALALVLYLSPIIRAYGVARHLDQNLSRSFGLPDPKEKVSPFRWQQLFMGIGAASVGYRTLTYGSADGAGLTLDFYPAHRQGIRPCVIIIHGGGWSTGDSRQLPGLNSRLSKDGYSVASINYRLAPRYHNPQPVEDVQASLSFLRAHAADLSIDTNTFVLLGRSAGAQIALLAAYTLHDTAIKGVISFYGPADMVWGYSVPANPLVMDSRKMMSDYLGGTYPAVPKNYFNSSPIEFVTPASVPTLLIHGQQDPLVAYEHSVRLNKKLADSGVRHYLVTLPWATHGFDYSLSSPGGQLSTFSVERFLGMVAP